MNLQNVLILKGVTATAAPFDDVVTTVNLIQETASLQTEEECITFGKTHFLFTTN